MNAMEAAKNPLLLQSDRGPVAYKKYPLACAEGNDRTPI